MTRKKKRDPFGFFDDFFGDFNFFGFDIDDLGSGGYSIEMYFDGENQVVNVRTFGDVDINKIVDQIKAKYPSARILVNGKDVTDEEIGPREIKPISSESSSKDSSQSNVEKPKKGVVTYTFTESGELKKIGADDKKKSVLDLFGKKKRFPF